MFLCSLNIYSDGGEGWSLRKETKMKSTRFEVCTRSDTRNTRSNPWRLIHLGWRAEIAREDTWVVLENKWMDLGCKSVKDNLPREPIRPWRCFEMLLLKETPRIKKQVWNKTTKIAQLRAQKMDESSSKSTTKKLTWFIWYYIIILITRGADENMYRSTMDWSNLIEAEYR